MELVEPRFKADAPDLTAYATDDRWLIWCAFCLRWHVHGAKPGHRVAHCHHCNSPYDGIGYNLVGSVPAPPWLKRDFRRGQMRRPEEGARPCRYEASRRSRPEV